MSEHLPTSNNSHVAALKHFAQCNCEGCSSMVEYGTWLAAYRRGYRAASFGLPATVGHVQITAHAVYIGHPQGWDNVKTY